MSILNFYNLEPVALVNFYIAGKKEPLYFEGWEQNKHLFSWIHQNPTEIEQKRIEIEQQTMPNRISYLDIYSDRTYQIRWNTEREHLNMKSF